MPSTHGIFKPDKIPFFLISWNFQTGQNTLFFNKIPVVLVKRGAYVLAQSVWLTMKNKN